jgi:hypothetical protein
MWEICRARVIGSTPLLVARGVGEQAWGKKPFIRATALWRYPSRPYAPSISCLTAWEATEATTVMLVLERIFDTADSMSACISFLSSRRSRRVLSPAPSQFSSNSRIRGLKPSLGGCTYGAPPPKSAAATDNTAKRYTKNIVISAVITSIHIYI